MWPCVCVCLTMFVPVCLFPSLCKSKCVFVYVYPWPEYLCECVGLCGWLFVCVFVSMPDGRPDLKIMKQHPGVLDARHPVLRHSGTKNLALLLRSQKYLKTSFWQKRNLVRQIRKWIMYHSYWSRASWCVYQNVYFVIFCRIIFSRANIYKPKNIYSFVSDPPGDEKKSHPGCHNFIFLGNYIYYISGSAKDQKRGQTANFEHLLKIGMNTSWMVYFRFLPGGKLKNH